jgi:hypothetical protein
MAFFRDDNKKLNELNKKNINVYWRKIVIVHNEKLNKINN